MDKQFAEQLLEMIKANEWSIHHAAENRYCPYCMTDSETWEDRTEHHAGCKWVETVQRLEEYILAMA